MDLQASYIDGLSAQMMRERSNTQMTLGRMIEALEAIPPETNIKGLGKLDSYRGYYSDLAFAPTNSTETAKDLLARCKGAMGQVFTGYKGGDYVMGALTPLWLADYGDCGDKIIAINSDGTIKTETEFDD